MVDTARAPAERAAMTSCFVLRSPLAMMGCEILVVRRLMMPGMTPGMMSMAVGFSGCRVRLRSDMESSRKKRWIVTSPSSWA